MTSSASSRDSILSNISEMRLRVAKSSFAKPRGRGLDRNSEMIFEEIPPTMATIGISTHTHSAGEPEDANGRLLVKSEIMFWFRLRRAFTLIRRAALPNAKLHR